MRTHMSMRVPLCDNTGQSLVGVMVGFGLMGILAVGLAQLNSNSMMSQNTVRMNADFNNLGSLVAMALQNTALCNSNINATNLAQLTFSRAPGLLASQSISVNKLTYPNGDVIVQTGGNAGNQLKVSDLKFNQFHEITAGTSYVAMLHIEVTKTAGSAVGSSVLLKDVPVSFATHTTSGNTVQIDSCGSGAAAPTQHWTDVTSSRALNTPYTNTTGGPLLVTLIVRAQPLILPGGVTFFVDGVKTAEFLCPANICTSTLSTTVPAGSTYSATATLTSSFTSWQEFR